MTSRGEVNAPGIVTCPQAAVDLLMNVSRTFGAGTCWLSTGNKPHKLKCVEACLPALLSLSVSRGPEYHCSMERHLGFWRFGSKTKITRQGDALLGFSWAAELHSSVGRGLNLPTVLGPDDLCLLTL